MKKNASQAAESGEDEVVFPWEFRKHEAIMNTARDVCETSADAVMCFMVAIVSLLSDREIAHHLLDSAYDAIESHDKAREEARERCTDEETKAQRDTYGKGRGDQVR